MRHPSTVRREGDLSRLTSSSSSTPSSSTATDSSNGNFQLPNDNSSDNANDGATAATVTAECCGGSGNVSADLNATAPDNGGAGAAVGFRSNYLPAVIDPADWPSSQLSRKRKDRQDSTSSSTQHDRKLIRSNSEEFIPTSSADIGPAGDTAGAGAGSSGGVHIRRVCSHEEFKRPLQERQRNGREANADARPAVAKLQQWVAGNAAAPAADDAVVAAETEKRANKEVQDILKETATTHHRSRNEVSPARVTRAFDYSHKMRVSPCRDGGAKSGGTGSKYSSGGASGSGGAVDNDADGEHERRRSSERFCRARAPTGRKQSAKRPSKYLAARLRGGRDESVYKYDLQLTKGERRAFASGAGGGKHAGRTGDEENNDPLSPVLPQPPSSQEHDVNDNNVVDIIGLQQSSSNSSSTTNALNSPKIKRKSDTLPWERSSSHSDEHQAPVVCPRFADATYAQVHHHRIINDDDDSNGCDDDDDANDVDDTNSQSLLLQHHRRRSSSSSENTTSAGAGSAITSISSTSSNTWRHLGHFMKSENLKTREIMQNIKAPMAGYRGQFGSSATPDEMMRQTNKRLAALKRRIAGYEEAFEQENGYRPSQADKQNDRYMKNALAEMHKLRREKQLLKADPMTAMGLRRGSGPLSADGATSDAASRMVRVRETMQEIEVRLADKRTAGQRPFALDQLTTDQLMLEKTAVQKALVYFESVHGRPVTRDERDAARELYGRYRTLKRLVNRTVSMQVSGISGLSELPTIMEHEAMQFVAVGTATAASEEATSSTSLAACLANVATTAAAIIQQPVAVGPDSPLSELSTTESTDTTSSSVHENVHQLSLDELWHHLEVAREQKLEMRRTIKDFEAVFEQQNGRRMLKSDRSMIEQTYAVYKQRKAKLRLLEALVKKHMAK